MLDFFSFSHQPICFFFFFFRIYRFLFFLCTSGESAWIWKSPMNWGTFITVSWRNFEQIKKSYLHLREKWKNEMIHRNKGCHSFFFSNKFVPLFFILSHLSWISKLFIWSNQKRSFYLNFRGIGDSSIFFSLSYFRCSNSVFYHNWHTVIVDCTEHCVNFWNLSGTYCRIFKLSSCKSWVFDDKSKEEMLIIITAAKAFRCFGFWTKASFVSLEMTL